MKRFSFLFLALIFGCKGNLVFPPEARIVSGPEDQGVILSNTVTFKWEGNKFAEEYRFTIDSVQSRWTKQESISLVLDDGWHTFTLVSRNLLGEIQDDPSIVHFKVDGIRNGFSISPILDSIPRTSFAHVRIRAESPPEHSYEHILLRWTKGMFDVMDVVIDSSSYSVNGFPAIIKKIYSDSLEIYLGMLDGEIPQEDRVIAEVQLLPREAGTVYIELEAVIYDREGNAIPIDTLQGGEIVVF